MSVLNGCNTHSGIYKAFSNSSVVFGQFISTLKFCSTDKDSLYTSALISSASFSKSNNQITFKNSNGATVLILTAYQDPKPVFFDNTYKPSLNVDTDLLIRL